MWTNVPWPESLTLTLGWWASSRQRLAPRLAGDRHARVDQHERQVGVGGHEALRRLELVREDLQLEDEAELGGQLCEVFVERTIRRPVGAGGEAKRLVFVPVQLQAGAAQQRRDRELRLVASSIASGLKRSAEPTIACGQPVRSCCSCTHATSSKRVLERPVGLHVDGLAEALAPARRPCTPRRCTPCPAAARRGRRCAGSSGRRARGARGRPDVVMRVDVSQIALHLLRSEGRSRAPARPSMSSWMAAMARVTGR